MIKNLELLSGWTIWKFKVPNEHLNDPESEKKRVCIITDPYFDIEDIESDEDLKDYYPDYAPSTSKYEKYKDEPGAVVIEDDEALYNLFHLNRPTVFRFSKLGKDYIAVSAYDILNSGEYIGKVPADVKSQIKNIVNNDIKELPNLTSKLEKLFNQTNNKHLIEEVNAEEILDYVYKNLKLSDKPTEGASYILPNGKFLDLWSKNPVKPYMKDDKVIHRDVQQHLYDKGLVDDDRFDVDRPAMEEAGCIRVNGGYEAYIWLPDDRPNEEQWNSLLIWLDWFFNFHDGLLVGFKTQARTFNKDDYTNDELIKKFKSAYGTGILREDILQENNFLDLCKDRNIHFKVEDENKLIFDNYRDMLKALQLCMDMSISYHQDKKSITIDKKYLNESNTDNNLEDRVINYLIKNFSDKEIKKAPGSYLILRDGTIIVCDFHPDLIDSMCESGEFSEEEMSLFDSTGSELFTELLNCVRATIDKEENYIALPEQKLTEEQYDKLLELLDFDSVHYKSVMITTDGSRQYDSNNYKIYNFNETISDEIVDKIKRFYTTGNLVEKIVKKGSKWQVQSEKGKNLGTYDTKAEAEDRLKQVHYFKHMNEEVDEFDSIVKTELDALNNWLDEYGFEVELVTDEEELDYVDWTKQYGSEAVGMFLQDLQDNASVFPIALNRKAIEEITKEEDLDLRDGIEGTLWHEAGHGIYRFLEDTMDMPEDEEDCVEEFARYREISELFDILQDYMKQDESLNESKQDIEKFRQWAGNKLADRFFAIKDRIKDEDKDLRDIYWWMSLEANKCFGDDKQVKDALRDFVKEIENTPTRKERNKLAQAGSQKIYEDDNWLVIRIDTYESAVKYGKGTQWCITGNNTYDGRRDFNLQSDSDYYKFYFYIPKNSKLGKNVKYCLKYANDRDWCLFDETDFPHVGYGNAFNDGVDSAGDYWREGDMRDDFPTISGLPDINKAYEDINESLKEDTQQSSILNALDNEFGQSDVYMWSTYILPNGHFLNPDNSDSFEDEEPQYEHCDFEDWAWAEGYHDLDTIYNNCIKLNVTYPYLAIPKKWTTEQQNAVRKILDNQDKLYFEEPLDGWLSDFGDKINYMGPRCLAVFTNVGNEIFDLDVNSTEEIIKSINQAYTRGGFFSESLHEEMLRGEDTDTVYAFDMLVTNSPYEVKQKLLNSKDAMRVFIDAHQNLYLVSRAYECTHTNMIELANDNGYDTSIDDYDNEKVCIVYSPKDEYNNLSDFDTEDASDDDYTYMYIYDNFVVFSRYQDFNNFELSRVLGKHTTKKVPVRRY